MLAHLDQLFWGHPGRLFPSGLSGPAHQVQVGTRTGSPGAHFLSGLGVPVGWVVTGLQVNHVPAVVPEDLVELLVGTPGMAIPAEPTFVVYPKRTGRAPVFVVGNRAATQPPLTCGLGPESFKHSPDTWVLL